MTPCAPRPHLLPRQARYAALEALQDCRARDDKQAQAIKENPIMSPASIRSARAYAIVGVESRADGSGPHEVVLLLFEGLLERIALGKLAIEQRDVSNKIRHLERALQILGEGLRTHLDLKAGGELAQQLDQLYGYCSVRLLQANIHNDAAALTEVQTLLQPIAQAWSDSRPGTASARAASPASGGSSASPVSPIQPSATRSAYQAAPAYGSAFMRAGYVL